MYISMRWTRIFAILLSCLTFYASGIELTFELPDKAKECFHEIIPQNQSVSVDYQVVTGGAYDVDTVIFDPKEKKLYEKTKSTYDTLQFQSEHTGVYTVCFSNEFSTFTHKLVYMELRVGEEAPLPGLEHQITVMTQMESSMTGVYADLKKIEDFQTYHRLREAQSRKSAEDLNERVLLWSVLETIGIILVSITQVFVVRTLFSEKRPSHQLRYAVIQ